MPSIGIIDYGTPSDYDKEHNCPRILHLERRVFGMSYEHYTAQSLDFDSNVISIEDRLGAMQEDIDLLKKKITDTLTGKKIETLGVNYV